uniref:Uncharacterized protein n=1 Tax=Favella ehrenbergii TaxID=182087 RepID=A0A7S3HYD4_9SPIT|mmetsp:Transcript_18084/g.22596  ORF Transcript_18084/g.22596 Transcript_18084/m.22596 type:complete len:223 (+) Transcript_18084:4250-4918(+)
MLETVAEVAHLFSEVLPFFVVLVSAVIASCCTTLGHAFYDFEGIFIGGLLLLLLIFCLLFFFLLVEVVGLYDALELEALAHDVLAALFVAVVIIALRISQVSFLAFVPVVARHVLSGLLAILTVVKLQLFAVLVHVVFFLNRINFVLLCNLLLEALPKVTLVAHGHLVFPLDHSVGGVDVVECNGQILFDHRLSLNGTQLFLVAVQTVQQQLPLLQLLIAFD